MISLCPSIKRGPRRRCRQLQDRWRLCPIPGTVAGTQEPDAARKRLCADPQAGFPHKLVLAGLQDTLFQPVLSRIRELKLENEILLPGYVAAADLPDFYNAAEVFVYPSLFEGFGLPIMEAMACGTPVVTSRGSSLEEVAGDAAVLVDPLDELSIAEALKRVLAEPELRKRLAKPVCEGAGSLASRTLHGRQSEFTSG